MPKHVRLKPYDPKRGQVVRKYTYGPTGQRFEEASGWYIVDDALADKLEDLTQTRDPMSPAMFDVCTAKEAKDIDARERKAKARRDADTANDMSTKDLRTPVDERREARAARLRGGRQRGATGARSMT